MAEPTPNCASPVSAWLFLDFSGVLDTPSAELYVPWAGMEPFARWIGTQPAIGLVVTETERAEVPVERLLEPLPASVRRRVHAVLPAAAQDRGDGGRQALAMQWLAERPPELSCLPWAALDDEPRLWASAERVVAVDAARGFSAAHGQALERILMSEVASGGAPKTVAAGQDKRSTDAELRQEACAPRRSEKSQAKPPARAPLGVRQQRAVVRRYHPEAQLVEAALLGRVQRVVFARRLYEGSSVLPGQQLSLWLSRDGLVLRALD